MNDPKSGTYDVVAAFATVEAAELMLLRHTVPATLAYATVRERLVGLHGLVGGRYLTRACTRLRRTAHQVHCSLVSHVCHDGFLLFLSRGSASRGRIVLRLRHGLLGRFRLLNLGRGWCRLRRAVSLHGLTKSRLLLM